MKMYFSVVLCALYVVPLAHAENRFIRGLQQSQRQAPAVVAGQSGAPGNVPVVDAPPEIAPAGSTIETRNCSPAAQKSVPLAFLNSMVGIRNASFRPVYDEVSGTLKLQAPDVASNCIRMLRFELSSPTSNIREYVIRARIDDCGSATCQYPVSRMVNGAVNDEGTVNVAPTFNGLIQCLRETGALNADGSANESNILRQNFEQTWNNVRPSTGRADLVFASQEAMGSSDDRIPAMYGSLRAVGDCYVLERITPDARFVLASSEALEEDQLARQAADICRSGNRDQMADFLSRYGDNSELGRVVGRALRDSILRDVQTLADAIRNNRELRDADMSVLNEFQTRVIEPLVNRMTDLYNRIQRLPPNDPQRRRLQAELDELARELTAYSRAPYPTQADLQRLTRAGRFEEAETLNGIILTVSNFRRLGGEDRGARITPRLALRNVNEGKEDYTDEIRQQRVDWDVRTGRITGRSEHYSRLANAIERDIQERSRDIPLQIQRQYERMQTVCPRMILQQSILQCIQAAQNCIARLQRQHQAWDAQDRESIRRLRSRASHYAALEAEAESSGSSDDDERGPASEGQDALPEDLPERNPTRGEVDDPGSSTYPLRVDGIGNGMQQPQGGWYGNGNVAQTSPGSLQSGGWPGPNGLAGQQGGWYGQSAAGQGSYFPQQGYPGQFPAQGNFFPQAGFQGQFPQNLGLGASYNYQGVSGQMPGQFFGGQPVPGAYMPGQFPLQAQGGFFGGTQSPYQGWGGQYQTSPFLGQATPFTNPQLQNFGSPMAGYNWYGNR